MSNKPTSLKDVISAIQPGKPRILSPVAHKQPQFTAPQPVADLGWGRLPQGKCTQGELPQGSLPEGELPQVPLPQGPSPQPKDQPEQGAPTQPLRNEHLEIEAAASATHRGKRRRETLASAAFAINSQLHPENQEQRVKEILSEGWGKLAHSVARQLKAPTRYGLKLVDVAVIVTVYDKTIAQVSPRMYAAISNQDFENETGMDSSNLRASLRTLVTRGVLTKITHKTLNLWGLNHLYFDPLRWGQSPQGKRTQGEPPQGDLRQTSWGNSPQVNLGQTTPLDGASSDCNYSVKVAPKNLLKESKKESLSCESVFPKDMKKRWSGFGTEGKFGNVTKEKEIFDELFVAYGNPFFQNCGKVIQFLESHGNGKAGDAGKVHSPMVYIRSHWEHNLNRYQAWVTRQQELQAVIAHKAHLEAQKRDQQDRQAITEAQDEAEAAREEAAKQSALQSLLAKFPTAKGFNEFVTETIQRMGCEFTRNSWRTRGWESPLVRERVLSFVAQHEPTPTAKTG